MVPGHTSHQIDMGYLGKHTNLQEKETPISLLIATTLVL